MDAADLDRRARTLSGCVPPLLVSRLLELGHGDEVQFQAGRGEWFCAREWTCLLSERGRQSEALDVLAPYVATGWWPAVQAQAELLERWGRPEEAITLAQPYAETGGCALEFFARLLARHGRQDEAVTLLSAGVDDRLLATALVDVADAAGRHEDAAVLLAARIPDQHRCDSPWCCRGLDIDTAIGLLATVRERQDRVDEAIALLRTRHGTSFNGRDQLADLLARHDRIEELRSYAASEYLGHAAQRLAEMLEERGDVEGAIAVYQQPGDSSLHRRHGTVHLAQLLARHGRGDEAIEVMRALADSPGGAEDWIVDALCTLYADHGRSRDGIAYLDSLNRGSGGEEEEWLFFRMRLLLMINCGLTDEAIEHARAHPDSDTWYAAWTIAELLADAGWIEEAVTVLEPHASANRELLAGYLIELGRIKDAVALLQQRTSEPVTPTPVWSGTFSTEPPV